MNSIQLFGSLRPTTTLFVQRYSFSQKDRIKLLNYTSKSLYGPVIKKKPNKKSQPSVTASVSPEVTAVKKPETNYGSEMHWIVGNKWNDLLADNEPIVLEDSTKKKLSDETLQKQPENDSSINAKENPSDSKVSSSPTTSFVPQKAFLLSNEQLNNVLKHPLQTDVLSPPPTDIRNWALRNVPSVGKILQHTMSESARAALLNWKLTKIRELGEKGFADLQQCKHPGWKLTLPF